MSKKSNKPLHSTIAKIKGPTQQQVKVLYQNLGGTWYAFADLNDEVFFAPVNIKQIAPQPELGTSKKKKPLLKDGHK